MNKKIVDNFFIIFFKLYKMIYKRFIVSSLQIFIELAHIKIKGHQPLP